MKKNLTITAVVVGVFLAAGVIKDQIIKAAITVAVTKITGAPAHIDGFSLGILTQSVRISGFKIYNPAGFSKNLLVDLPKIKVKIDTLALLKKKIHLINTEVELKEMVLEKNKEGKLNVDSLNVAKQEDSRQGGFAQQISLQIDLLKLKIGRIISKDFSAGDKPLVSVYDIKLNKEYKNITSAQQLAALILTEPMKAAGIEGAKIYGAAMLTGVAFFPVAIAANFLGNDSASSDFDASSGEVYRAASEVLKKLGNITSEDKAAGALSAEVSSASVTVKITQKGSNKIEVNVTARKYLFPKPEIAAGVLYGISEELK